MRGQKQWIKCEDGTRVTIRKQLTVEGDEAFGAYDPNTGGIEIAADLPETMRRKLFHELGHKMMHDITGRARVDVFGECTDEEFDDREEALCCLLEDRFYDLLTRNGWLKFPKPPLCIR